MLNLRVMTYNIGGGRRDAGSNREAILKVIKEVAPDVLALQEVTDYQDADGQWHGFAGKVARAGRFGEHYCFAPTLTMKEHMHVQKTAFVQAVFNDWLDWRHGNALFCRGGFTRLGDVHIAGTARNVPLFQPPVYEGNRDTDPRYALLARVKMGPIFPFIVGTHLTTLVGEREGDAPDIVERAHQVRLMQVRQILTLLRQHVLETDQPVILMGDLNAEVTEPALAEALTQDGGFVRLVPEDASVSTYPSAARVIDHVFVYPADRIKSYRCWVEQSGDAQRASDHLPVVADLEIE